MTTSLLRSEFGGVVKTIKVDRDIPPKAIRHAIRLITKPLTPRELHNSSISLSPKSQELLDKTE